MSKAKAHVGKPRVLCLHAYGGNAHDFENQTKELRLPFKDDVDWIFMEARVEDPDVAGGRIWWTYPQWDAAADPLGFHAVTQYLGLAEFFAQVAEEEKRGGAFSGVLGFSQGAVAASCLCALPSSSVRWGVLLSGFVPLDPLASFGSSRQFPTRTLHVMGSEDAVVPPAATRALACRFAGAEEVLHDKGHIAQLPAEARQRVVDFIQRQLEWEWAGGEPLQSFGEAAVASPPLLHVSGDAAGILPTSESLERGASTVEVTLLFFASAREAAGVSTIKLAVQSSASSDSITTDDLKIAIVAKYPIMEAMLRGCPPSFTLAVNQKYLKADEVLILKDGYECAVIPPISGG